MRSPSEIGPDFLRTFWTRKIHPELYLLEMEGFGLHIQQAGGAKAPLEISFFSQAEFLVFPLLGLACKSALNIEYAMDS